MSGRAGLFVTLEGGEGAGKSTLAAWLTLTLQERGEAVVATREPGGTPGADEIRRLLVEGEPGRWDALTEALLLSAARRDHARRRIAPALAAGAIVLCDRYLDSTEAYQTARGAPREGVRALSRLIEAPQPDLTLLLDIDPALGLGRGRGATVGEDRFERMGAAFHARVRQTFIDIATREPKRCLILDASAPEAAVREAALTAILARRAPA